MPPPVLSQRRRSEAYEPGTGDRRAAMMVDVWATPIDSLILLANIRSNNTSSEMRVRSARVLCLSDASSILRGRIDRL